MPRRYKNIRSKWQSSAHPSSLACSPYSFAKAYTSSIRKLLRSYFGYADEKLTIHKIIISDLSGSANKKTQLVCMDSKNTLSTSFGGR